MTADAISSIRNDLGLSQAKFAELLGVHPVTVSKWERGVLSPNSHQVALIQKFSEASEKNEEIGETAESLLVTAGVALALYALLDAAFNND